MVLYGLARHNLGIKSVSNEPVDQAIGMATNIHSSSTWDHASPASLGGIMPLSIIPSSTWDHASGNFYHAWFAVDRKTQSETSWGTYFDMYHR